MTHYHDIIKLHGAYLSMTNSTLSFEALGNNWESKQKRDTNINRYHHDGIPIIQFKGIPTLKKYTNITERDY